MALDSGTSMGAPFFLHELKKQASYYFKEKIRTARLALTDVTPAELWTEEVTNGSPWAPDAMTMRRISRAAFEIDDYWRIVEILHKRLAKFERNRWREAYKALILLEHLLTHGPGSVSEEFQSDRDVIMEMGDFQYIDEKGFRDLYRFNWGVTVRNKSERVLKLLEKGPLLREERDRARKISRGIQGFGSFNVCLSSDKCSADFSQIYGRSYSHYENYDRQESAVSVSKEVNPNSDVKLDAGAAGKENRFPTKSNSVTKVHPPDESKPLLVQEEERKSAFLNEEHPFSKLERHNMDSLLLLNQS